ncbi:MAG: rod shape-determining protein MreD [Burkholderiales bacterium]|jgi:rod shape-determining protein MreD|nr:rod shape-determining protein MreD [Burkholderiales bacterium]
MKKTVVCERATPTLPPEPIHQHAFLRPPHLLFIIFSLLIALLLNLLPLPHSLQIWCPDFVALVLLYWCIWSPRHIGIVAGFMLGLLMDVADATVFGQHALLYTLLAFGADFFRRRLLSFPLWQQTISMALLLEFCAVLMFVVRMMSGGAPPSSSYFIVPTYSALLWIPMQYFLQLPQRRPSGNN